MEGARIGGLALIGLAALLVLRQYKPEWAPFIRMAVTVAAMGSILTMAGSVITCLSDLTEGMGAPSGDTRALLLKALGVAFLTETSATICRDSGENTLAGWVETAGKLEILLLSFPLIRTVMETVADLLGRG